MPTFTEVLAHAGVTVPDETIAQLEVPVLTGPQRQGDVLVIPRAPLSDAERDAMAPIPTEGVAVVRGEATGNTHMLHAEGPVTFARKSAGLVIGVLDVPQGAVAWLIHTDEHGANGIGPGCYALHGKREQADEIRRVMD